MEFKLIIFEGTDTIKFGMSSEEIQLILKVKPTILKSAVTNHNIDYYPNICKAFFEVGENNKLLSAEFEFYKPAKVLLDGVQLMGKPFLEIEDLFKSKFKDYSNSIMDGPYSEEYGVGFSCTHLSNKKAIVDSVSISRKGYRKEQMELFEREYGIRKSIGNMQNREYICLKCRGVISSETPIIICPKCNVYMIPK